MLKEFETWTEESRITSEEILEAQKLIAEELMHRYGKNRFTLLGVRKGGVLFSGGVAAELGKLGSRVMYGMIGASSFEGEKQQKQIVIYAPPSWHLVNRSPVVVIDDIIDSGKTLATVGHFLTKQLGAKSVEMGAMVVKKLPKWANADYCGFKLPEDAPYVVGWGLDYFDALRDLDHVRSLTEEDRERHGVRTADSTDTATPEELRDADSGETAVAPI